MVLQAYHSKRPILHSPIQWQQMDRLLNVLKRQKKAMAAVATTAQIPPIRMYTAIGDNEKWDAHSWIVLDRWMKAYHRSGTGQRVAHSETRNPPQFGHTVWTNVMIWERKQVSPWGRVQSSRCFHSCCIGWTGRNLRSVLSQQWESMIEPPIHVKRLDLLYCIVCSNLNHLLSPRLGVRLP